MKAFAIRRTLILTGLAIIALGAAALAGLRHPAAPGPELQQFLPQITLPAVLLAGLVDGINPCAFTVLLLFVTAVLATLTSAQIGPGEARRRILGMGSIYIGSILLTYLALGVGILRTLDLLSRQHWPARLGALLAILFGLWMLKDFFLADWGWRLQAPAKVGVLAHAAARRATVPSLVVGGFLIGLCTVPCSGAVYLAVLSLLAMQPSALVGYSYLVLYNVVFVLPLVAILLLVSMRPMLGRLSHWNLHHKEWVRLALGSGVVVMGLAILATV
ncbi:MAG TPA: cytochrome c biogenesis protein CcdA [Anaerolineales bacterium]